MIGVIVAGLGIGALISAYQNRGAPPTQLGAGVPPVTPVPQETAAPDQSPLALASATPAPSPSPSVTPRPTPAPTRSTAPSPSPAPSASASPADTPSPAATDTPTSAPTATPTPVVTARPTPTPLVTARPTPTERPTPEPTATPRPPAAVAVAPLPARVAESDAASIVRRYLDAVIAGNVASAGALLANGGTVKEAAVLDDSAHITSVHVTRSDPSGAFVEADFTTSRGSYVATFHVSGGTIDQHDYIKE